ncbi:hypothetical protein [Paracoccus sp. (in: a-proteobacteria)]|uniref:hypothetical protein n=1 Tax=Paracoccus sp. TaxID=267 RepID=UPI0034CFD04E
MTAYNLTVNEFHTYFVTANTNAAPVWVHNNCPDGPGGGNAGAIAGRPVQFDGQFYSADGFKFSASYYNRLWSSEARPAPFLQARAIMDSNPAITPDPRGAAGYFRYKGAGMEIIYNPTTGQVGHIQPLR